jgi:hypothetical protein
MENVEYIQLFMLMSSCMVVVADTFELLEEQSRRNLQAHILEQRRLCRSLPLEKTRPTWTGFCNTISDAHFRKQFRMTRCAFTNLCNSLSAAVGDHVFRSENGFLSTRNSESLSSRGGLIPGEVKTAISIRILAGGSYLDLMPLFCVSVPYIYKIFDQFLDWVMQALQSYTTTIGRL